MNGHRIPVITHRADSTSVQAPFSTELNEEYKRRGLRWNASDKTWVFLHGNLGLPVIIAVRLGLKDLLLAHFSVVHVAGESGGITRYSAPPTTAGAKLLADLEQTPTNGREVRWYRDMLGDMEEAIREMEQGDRRQALEDLARSFLTPEQLSQLGFRLLQAAAQRQKAGSS